METPKNFFSCFWAELQIPRSYVVTFFYIKVSNVGKY